MTGYQSKRAAARDKLNDEDDTQVYKDHGDALTIAYQSGYYDGKKAAQRPWVDLTDEEKDGKRVLKNGLLFNAAEVQAWELGVDYAESKLKEKNT
jgi:hypothetical protein